MTGQAERDREGGVVGSRGGSGSRLGEPGRGGCWPQLGCGWGGGWGPHSAPGPDPAVLPPGGSGEEAVPAVTVNGQAASSFHGGCAWHPPPQIRVRVLGLRSAPLTTGWWVGPRGPDCGSGANRLEEGRRSQDRGRQARLSTGAAGGALAAGDRGRSESWGRGGHRAGPETRDLSQFPGAPPLPWARCIPRASRGLETSTNWGGARELRPGLWTNEAKLWDSLVGP